MYDFILHIAEALLSDTALLVTINRTNLITKQLDVEAKFES